MVSFFQVLGNETHNKFLEKANVSAINGDH